MTDLGSGLKTTANDLAVVAIRQIAILMVIGVCLLFAVGFGASAAWILIEAEYGAAAASGVLAGVSLLIAVIVLVATRTSKSKTKVENPNPAAAPAKSLNTALIQTFVECVHIGRQVGERRR